MSNPQSNAATNTQKTSTGVAAGLGNTAAGENAAINPTLTNQAQGKGTGFAPTDLNSMKVGAAQTAGGATAAANEAANLRATRTGNTAGLATSQDENARNRARVLADTNLKINSANAGVKQEQQQNALHQLGSMYATNIGGQNQATGNAIGAEKLMASQPTWLSDLNEGLQMSEQGALTGAKIASGG